MMKKNSKLAAKITRPILCSVVIGILVIVFFILNRFTVGLSDVNQKYIDTITEDYGKQIENKLAVTLNTAETLSFSIKSMMERSDVKREDVLGLVAEVLKNHEELVGIGVGFDPNAFDGKDSENIGKDHSDSNGRFVPYSYRNEGEIVYNLLEGYDDLGSDGSWYSVPKSTNKTYVTSPYWYDVGNEKFLIFTCVAPILDDQGKFIGMVGFDTLVDSLNSIVQEASIFDSGYLSLLSPDGTIAYHPKTSILGTSMYDSFPKIVSDTADNVYKEGKAIHVKAQSIANGKKSLNILMPIEVGLSGGRWIVMTSVPVEETTKLTRDIIVVAVAMGILMTCLIVFILTYIIKKNVLKPINVFKAATQKLSEGGLNVQIEYDNDDELGHLADNLQNTTKTLKLYIDNITFVLGEISKGNIAVAVDLDYIGDFIPIKTSMLQITDYLNNTLLQLAQSSDLVADGASQVSDGAQMLSSSTEEEAAAIEELTATIEEISGKIKGNADYAAQASSKAGTIGNDMLLNSQLMNQMTEAMIEINKGSVEIAKIIKTIEDISSQTNMLSLNATIEASRAGEMGKGFSVIANQVRDLAAKSSQASKSTTLLIDSSIKALENGTDIVNRTVQAMTSSMEGVNEIVSYIDQISVASNEQAVSIEEVTQGIGQISGVVQSNSATAEESAATSEELYSQSQILKGLVSDFQIKSGS